MNFAFNKIIISDAVADLACAVQVRKGLLDDPQQRQDVRDGLDRVRHLQELLVPYAQNLLLYKLQCQKQARPFRRRAPESGRVAVPSAQGHNSILAF